VPTTTTFDVRDNVTTGTASGGSVAPLYTLELLPGAIINNSGSGTPVIQLTSGVYNYHVVGDGTILGVGATPVNASGTSGIFSLECRTVSGNPSLAYTISLLGGGTLWVWVHVKEDIFNHGGEGAVTIGDVEFCSLKFNRINSNGGYGIDLAGSFAHPKTRIFVRGDEIVGGFITNSSNTGGEDVDYLADVQVRRVYTATENAALDVDGNLGPTTVIYEVAQAIAAGPAASVTTCSNGCLVLIRNSHLVSTFNDATGSAAFVDNATDVLTLENCVLEPHTAATYCIATGGSVENIALVGVDTCLVLDKLPDPNVRFTGIGVLRCQTSTGIVEYSA